MQDLAAINSREDILKYLDAAGAQQEATNPKLAKSLQVMVMKIMPDGDDDANDNDDEEVGVEGNRKQKSISGICLKKREILHFMMNNSLLQNLSYWSRFPRLKPKTVFFFGCFKFTAMIFR